MVTEDKLKYFYDSTISALKKKNDEELAVLKEQLDEEMKSYKSEIDAHSLIEERLHRDSIRREGLKDLARQKMALRKIMSEKEEEIRSAIFDEAAEIIEAHRHSPEYADTLLNYISFAKKFAQGDEMKVYICPSDIALKETLEERSGIELRVSDVPFNGGIQAELPGKNIFINYSFSSRIEEEKQAYIVRG